MEVKNCPIAKDNITTQKKTELENCPICFDEIDNDEKGVTKCMHTFHDTCILKWMAKSSKCPLCNFELNPVGCEVHFRDFEDIPFSDDYNESEEEEEEESEEDYDEHKEDYDEHKEDYDEHKEDVIGIMRVSGRLSNEFHLPAEVSTETEFERIYVNLLDSIDKEDFCKYIGKNRLLTILEKIQISILTHAH